MTIKLPSVPIMFIIGAMGWAYGFGMSGTKITDMWYLGMAVMIMFHGLEQLMKDYDAARAQVFGKISNVSMFITLGLGILTLISPLL